MGTREREISRMVPRILTVTSGDGEAGDSGRGGGRMGKGCES